MINENIENFDFFSTFFDFFEVDKFLVDYFELKITQHF